MRYVHILKGLDYEQSNPSPQIARWIDSLDVVRTAINVKNILTKESIEEASELVAEMGLSVVMFKKACNEIIYNHLNGSS